ncbi:hypothetical protein ACN4EE_02780 [Geminocystis sp. CENA526]|uniref:hypothetical protein n=1 Tax=Geminocystis sp. CENA526 TaxID=1355871 RepID=UPI003D6DF7B7
MNNNPNLLNWQENLIATNLVAIGYNAWAGYLTASRGVITCSTNSPSMGITGETFKTHFVSRNRLTPFLNAWLATPDTVILQHHFMSAHILEAVDNYNPATEIILLLESFNQVTFFISKTFPLLPLNVISKYAENGLNFHLPPMRKTQKLFNLKFYREIRYIQLLSILILQFS